MNVIFLKDIPKIGKKGDIKNVSDGYAINFLVPKGLVRIATDSRVEQHGKEIKNLHKKEEKLVKKLEEIAKNLAKEVIEFKRKSTDGELFGSVSAKDIESELSKKGLGYASVLLEENIKKIGEYTVPIKLGGKIDAKIKIRVSEE